MAVGLVKSFGNKYSWYAGFSASLCSSCEWLKMPQSNKKKKIRPEENVLSIFNVLRKNNIEYYMLELPTNESKS